jgi:hypothetical protein
VALDEAFKYMMIDQVQAAGEIESAKTRMRAVVEPLVVPVCPVEGAPASLLCDQVGKDKHRVRVAKAKVRKMRGKYKKVRRTGAKRMRLVR